MELSNSHKDIILKPVELTDSDRIFTLIDKNREQFAQWFWWVETTQNVYNSLDFLREVKEKYEKKTDFVCGIWYKNEFVGLVSLTGIDFHTNSAMLGYWLDYDQEGKGVMTNSCKMLINYAFDTLKLHRIWIIHAEKNLKSKAVIERLGFTHEGHFRESTLVNGEYLNDEYYGLLEQEWKNGPSKI